MTRHFTAIWISVLSLSLVCSCQNSDQSNPDANGNGDDCGSDPRFEPLDDEESELIALCLSRDIVASENLYNQVLGELEAIRSTFGSGSPDITQISFSPPWTPSALMLDFDDATTGDVVSGEYHDWDLLNDKYHLIDTQTIDQFGIVLLTFEGRLHPWCLRVEYKDLPGVDTAGPNLYLGDRSSIFPRMTGDDITYLFYKGAGDCPSGCTEKYYWYFVFEQVQPTLIGYWDCQLEPQEPDWWAEANKNIQQYKRW